MWFSTKAGVTAKKCGAKCTNKINMVESNDEICSAKECNNRPFKSNPLLLTTQEFEGKGIGVVAAKDIKAHLFVL